MGNDDSRQKDLFTDHLDAARRFIVPMKKKLSPGDYYAFTGGNFMRVIERVLG
jgi:hypothetical protein